jgi:tape measure domain-containing protein
MSRQGLEYIINLRGDNFSRGMERAKSQTAGLDSQFKKLGATIAGAFAVSQITAFGQEAVLTSAKVEGMERAIKFAGGQEGGKNLEYVRSEANRLGLDLMAAETGYRTLSGAMMGNVELAKQQNTIYTAVSSAISALGGDNEQLEGSILALSQMASKGTVNAEELRGQLGERLPGAFSIAARAMNMTEQQLGKAMEKGEVMATDFLPRFARELQNTFGDQATANANSFTAQMNRANNAMLDQTTTLGTMLQPAYLSWLNAKSQAIGLLTSAVKFIDENRAGFTALAVGVGAVATAYGLYVGIQKGALILQAIQYTSGLLHLAYLEGLSRGLGKAAAMQHALNVAMNLNPIGLIVTGIGLLAAGLYYAWQKSETFRGALKGLWAATQELLSPVMGLGKAVIGLFTANPAMLLQGLSEAKQAFANMDVKGAFSKAYNAEIGTGDKTATDKPGLATAGAMKGKQGAAAGGAAGKASAGTSVRNVNVNIKNLVERLEIKASTVKESSQNLRKEIASILIDATRDYEQAL